MDGIQITATVILVLFFVWCLMNYAEGKGYSKGYSTGFTKGTKSKPFDPKEDRRIENYKRKLYNTPHEKGVVDSRNHTNRS